MIDGYREPYHFNRNKNEGEVLIYIWEGIPNKLLADHFCSVKSKKKELVLLGSYHTPTQSDDYFFQQVKKGIDMYSNFYERYMLIADLNPYSQPCFF